MVPRLTKIMGKLSQLEKSVFPRLGFSKHKGQAGARTHTHTHSFVLNTSSFCNLSFQTCLRRNLEGVEFWRSNNWTSKRRVKIEVLGRVRSSNFSFVRETLFSTLLHSKLIEEVYRSSGSASAGNNLILKKLPTTESPVLGEFAKLLGRCPPCTLSEVAEG